MVLNDILSVAFFDLTCLCFALLWMIFNFSGCSIPESCKLQKASRKYIVILLLGLLLFENQRLVIALLRFCSMTNSSM